MIATVTLNSAVDKIFILPTRTLEKLNRVERGISIPGGGGINSAYAIQFLGTEAIVMGFVGGMAGRFIEDEIRKTQISTNFTYIKEQNRTDHIILNKHGKVLAQINEKGPWVSSKEIDSFIESFKRILPRCEMILLSGSLPQGVSPDLYADLITLAQERDVRVVLKTSKEALQSGIKAKPYMVLPDIRGTDVLMGIKVNGVKRRVELAKKVLEQGVRIVVQNIGNYQLFMTAEKAWEIKLPEVDVINSIGMGDALIAGVMNILKDREDFLEAMRYGAAASVVSALRVEAKINSREQVEGFLDRIEIKELDLS